MNNYIAAADKQPFREHGILYEYDSSDFYPDTILEKKKKIPYGTTEQGYFFLFHEGLAALQERIGINGLLTEEYLMNIETRSKIFKIIDETNNVCEYEVDFITEEESDEENSPKFVRKAHPFESLTILAFIEDELRKFNNPHYKILPLEKRWGTTYASEHYYAPGDGLDGHMSSKLFYILGYFELNDNIHNFTKQLNQILRLSECLEKNLDIKSKDKNAFEKLTKEYTYTNYFDFASYSYKTKRHEKERPVAEINDLLKDAIDALKIKLGYYYLYNDYQKVKKRKYRNSKLCDGWYKNDLAPRNVIFRGFDNDKPIFTIIDQYMTPGETWHKTNKWNRQMGFVMRVG